MPVRAQASGVKGRVAVAVAVGVSHAQKSTVGDGVNVADAVAKMSAVPVADQGSKVSAGVDVVVASMAFFVLATVGVAAGCEALAELLMTNTTNATKPATTPIMSAISMSSLKQLIPPAPGGIRS